MQVTVEEQYIKDIANAIREKTLGERLYLVSEMADAIRTDIPFAVSYSGQATAVQKGNAPFIVGESLIKLYNMFWWAEKEGDNE